MDDTGGTRDERRGGSDPERGPLSEIPSVSQIMETREMRQLEQRVGRRSAVALAREGQERVRRDLLSGEFGRGQAGHGGAEGATATRSALLARAVELACAGANRASATGTDLQLRAVINATGIVLNTNLGRAPLSRAAADSLRAAATGYCTVAVDKRTGRRRDRNLVVRGLLTGLTGAESALVVNNNAAATLLVINTLARGGEVVVSRGELVEIGGAFRLPDVIKSAGAKLVEVGTTNRTHLRDYTAAIGPETALVLKVHQSNYRIVGFTAEVGIEQLVELGRARNVRVADDIGSGALVETRSLGLPPEPSFARSLGAGADVVLASGDKLMGGPQCGIIAGRSSLIGLMHDNPLYRCLRVDKLTLAALGATLRAYMEYRDRRRGEGENEDGLGTLPPSLRLLCRPREELEAQALSVATAIRAAVAGQVAVGVQPTESYAGSGSLAGESLGSFAVCVGPAGHPGSPSAEQLARALRDPEPPLTPAYPRIEKGRVLMDMRAVFPEQLDALVETAVWALRHLGGRDAPDGAEEGGA